MAAGRKTGGRKKGTPNKIKVKSKASIVTEAAIAGETPLEYMLRILRDPTVDRDRRDRMAAAAAPYIHAKLASVQHAGAGGGPIETIIRWADERS